MKGGFTELFITLTLTLIINYKLLYETENLISHIHTVLFYLLQQETMINPNKLTVTAII